MGDVDARVGVGCVERVECNAQNGSTARTRAIWVGVTDNGGNQRSGNSVHFIAQRQLQQLAITGPNVELLVWPEGNCSRTLVLVQKLERMTRNTGEF